MRELFIIAQTISESNNIIKALIEELSKVTWDNNCNIAGLPVLN